ncbi:MAG TPA: glutamate racemase [Bdellovibrionota bacterium]|nr:glutamate racemase [Bdellovibrionota bacterium]
MKIGVFDSGVGGITVLMELRKAAPTADFVYLGDTANVPYGPKSPGQVERLSLEAVTRLRDRGIDALVVACNTASSLALPAIRATMKGIPVMGVVEPGAKAVIEQVRGGSTPILVLATRATVKSGAYAKALAGHGQVIEQECPLLVPMIEEGWLDHPILHATLEQYLAAHVKKGNSDAVALLGCTHYPWIQAAVERALPGWKVINSAQAVAQAFGEQLGFKAQSGPPSGRIEWIFTDPAAVPAFALRWVDKGNGLA